MTQPNTALTMIKDIVLNLSVDTSEHPAADYAISIADIVGAHLTGIAFAYLPEVPPDVYGLGAGYFLEWRDANERTAADAVAKFNEKARRVGLSSDSRTLTTAVAGAYVLFGRIARRFDMSIVGQARPDKPAWEKVVIEGGLFESGRPVIVVPYIQKAGLKLDRVMVCWDGSRAAARAVGDSMPLLNRAKAIDIVTVEREPAKSDEIPGADIAQHLARHGLNVVIERIVRGDVDVKDALLNYAADRGADLIVMGGYGHSRMREFILGGVTRGMLDSMTVPTLMSH